jgi:hypothetical protein
LINLPGRFCPHSPIISAGYSITKMRKGSRRNK